MNTIIALILVAWIMTCLTLIHHSHLRRAVHSALCHVVQSILAWKSKE